MSKCSVFSGHSLGEYTAACLAGALDIRQAISLVIARARVMSEISGGKMLAVFSSYNSIKEIVPDSVDVAGINGPNQVVLSSDELSITQFSEVLSSKQISNTILNTSSAFHSRLMDPILEKFKNIVKKKFSFNKLSKSVISNLTGEVLGPGFLYNADYWVQHLRNTVLFEEGIQPFTLKENTVFIEAGPGIVLSKLINSINTGHVKTIHTFKSSAEDENFSFTKAMGMVWASGGEIDLISLNCIKNYSKIHLPTYQFAENEHWIYPDKKIQDAGNKNNVMIRESADFSVEKQSEDQTVSQKLERVWRKVLGHSDISSTDNFYELGGDSLSATQLVSEINDEFGIYIELREILLSPVFEQLCNVIKNYISNPAYSPDDFPLMFPIQTSGDKVPVFLVAGAHDNRYFDRRVMKSSYEEDFMRYFSSIIKVLGNDQPLYGFRPRGIFFNETPHRNVKAMASAYIDEIKKVQPKGPYYIGGECVGGIVAIEIARQLNERNEKV